jgi:hypothetical protein
VPIRVGIGTLFLFCSIIGEEMNEQADFILKIDKQQNYLSQNAIYCALNREHGKMQITKDGMALICTAKGCQFATMPSLLEN